MEGVEGSLQLRAADGALGALKGGAALRKFPHLDGCTPLMLPADTQVRLGYGDPAGEKQLHETPDARH